MDTLPVVNAVYGQSVVHRLCKDGTDRIQMGKARKVRAGWLAARTSVLWR